MEDCEQNITDLRAVVEDLTLKIQSATANLTELTASMTARRELRNIVKTSDKTRDEKRQKN